MIWKWLHSLKLIVQIEKLKELEIKKLSSLRNNNRHIMFLTKDQVMDLDTRDLILWSIQRAWRKSLCMIKASYLWTTIQNASIVGVLKTQYLHKISWSNGRKFKSSSPFLKRLLTMWNHKILLIWVSTTTRTCHSLRKADRFNRFWALELSGRAQNQFTRMVRREFQESPPPGSLLNQRTSRERWELALAAKKPQAPFHWSISLPM